MDLSKPYLIGITGGSGSGKTYFLQQLLKRIGKEKVCLISQDHYYKVREEQPLDAQNIRNFDLPESVDAAAYTRDILKLLAGQDVEKEEYTFNNPNKKPGILRFESRSVIIVEGLFVFYFKEISELLDLKIFVDAKDPIKISRRIMRDNQERGYDLDDVLYRYQNHVMPAYEEFVEPFKYRTDLIVPNNRSCDKAIDVIVSHIKTFL
ncbi:MAG: uridine kinase [Bernardetiaceae bacterium]|nr:uridine kinase [Bernardetiaceae bacterium]